MLWWTTLGHKHAHVQAMLQNSANKDANTTNSAKRLKVWHAELYKEFRVVGDSSHFNPTSGLNEMSHETVVNKCFVLLLAKKLFVILAATLILRRAIRPEESHYGQ